MDYIEKNATPDDGVTKRKRVSKDNIGA